MTPWIPEIPIDRDHFKPPGATTPKIPKKRSPRPSPRILRAIPLGNALDTSFLEDAVEYDQWALLDLTGEPHTTISTSPPQFPPQEVVLDPEGEAMFNPRLISHLSSAEWSPQTTLPNIYCIGFANLSTRRSTSACSRSARDCFSQNHDHPRV